MRFILKCYGCVWQGRANSKYYTGRSSMRKPNGLLGAWADNIILTFYWGNGLPWPRTLVICWRPVAIAMLTCVIKCLQSLRLSWHRHIFLMNCKIDVLVTCGTGVMTGRLLQTCWKPHHLLFIMCQPRKWGWMNQIIYQHLSVMWPLSSELPLTALKYGSEIIASFKQKLCVCMWWTWRDQSLAVSCCFYSLL